MCKWNSSILHNISKLLQVHRNDFWGCWGRGAQLWNPIFKLNMQIQMWFHSFWLLMHLNACMCLILQGYLEEWYHLNQSRLPRKGDQLHPGLVAFCKIKVIIGSLVGFTHASLSYQVLTWKEETNNTMSGSCAPGPEQHTIRLWGHLSPLARGSSCWTRGCLESGYRTPELKLGGGRQPAV